jgi:Rod binding domain-containing protein
MNIAGLQPGMSEAPGNQRTARIAGADAKTAFDAVLCGVDQHDREALQEAASKLVSTAFVMPVLESLNQSPLRPTQGPFAAGGAEKRFTPLLHQEFADRITKSANFGLIDRIVDQFKSRLEGATHGPA